MIEDAEHLREFDAQRPPGVHAERVYRLFGRTGLGTSAFPPPNTPIGDTIAYHVRSGKHDLTRYDSYSYRVWADPTDIHLPYDGPQGDDPSPDPTARPDGYSPNWVSSNLISLALLTVIRFELADNIIWSPAPSASKAGRTQLRARSLMMKHPFSYNIHDIVSVVSDGVLPELEPFRVNTDVEAPTIRVKVGNPAFDVTPARYATGIVTENGIAYPPFEVNLRKIVESGK